MRLKVVVPLLLAFVGVAALALPVGALLAMIKQPGVSEEAAAQARLVTSLSFGVAAAAGLAAWSLLHLRLLRPLEGLAREASAFGRAGNVPAARLGAHLLERLPDDVRTLGTELSSARAETEAAVRDAVTRADQQRSRLEAILLDLTEGVIVANLDHRILLYNPAAARILEGRDTLGLGRPLFATLTSEPVLHTLEQLSHGAADAEERGDGAVAGGGQHAPRRFICATTDLGTLLEARMSLVREPSGEPSGYVLTFADVGEQVESLALRDSLLREVMIEWRRPLANLRAAAETLYSGEPPSADERAPFEQIVNNEVEALNQRFIEASRRYDRLAAGPWPMSDVLSLDLFNAARKHLSDIDRIELTLVGMPVWLHADSHSLLLAIEHLVRRTAAHTGQRLLDIEVTQGERRAYLEIVWQGEPVASAELESWLDVPLPGTLANRTARQIVERHGSELWSRTRPDGLASIRLPLQGAERRHAVPPVRIAPRPEYYDFDLFRVSDKALADTPLKQMRYVVFDTETTGLQPSAGDELLSIGAVRVVNGRILTGETFERLIDPGRDIPEASIKFHGITPDMVKGKPPAGIVLPQFRSWVGDSALVAYNIAFDMKFLELKEKQAGVRFDNPVLDALLLSIYLYKDASDHSLSGMARLLGIEMTGRHTAVGDAMAAAAVWVRLLDQLADRGIRTFGEAAQLSSRMMEERKLHLKF